MVNQHWAQMVVKKIASIIKKDVQVVNKSGQIIASSNSSQLGDIHQAALHSIQRNLPIEIEEEDMNFWKVKSPAVILPFEYQDTTYGALIISGTPEEVRESSRLLKVTAEFIIEQEIERSAKFKSSLSRTQMLSNILFNKDMTSHSYSRKQIIDFLGLNTKVAVASIFINTTSKTKIRSIKNTLSNWQLYDDDILELTPQDLLFVFKTNSNRGKTLEELKQFIAHSISLDIFERTLITVGDFNIGIQGLIQSYNEAQSLRKLVLSMNQTEGLYTYKDYEFEVICQNIRKYSPDKEASLIVNYKKLASFGGDKYLNETVEAYFRNHGKLVKTANDLYIHRNTLNYRIKKIHEITGWDLNTIDGIVLLRIAQYLYKTR
ncbi:sugar diacid recognition domain-containing protein [Staphylococcus americanisciuri]|uniref:Helix-turn-helix domain-containing protein n=1 Tax=Staphylococcus americanisciuri TaxID=2973940 RepID=A0ABT2F3R5_9STAP|nr:sugar diacid recognition domain-containing protein [Staphylococcus americanisciuri]MCS4487071.1 helix-turn-helix domain-containing protein [Staphylococcus americanisciuri]